MADYQLIIIGGGLSGLAAGIRSARFGQKTLIVEQHALPGGLNSYYYRQGYLLETGLHAMTNYAGPETKHAPSTGFSANSNFRVKSSLPMSSLAQR